MLRTHGYVLTSGRGARRDTFARGGSVVIPIAGPMSLRIALVRPAIVHGRPVRSCSGNPLIKAVREAGIEIRLQRHRARLDVPRSVLLLRAQQIPDGAPIGGIGRGQARGLQGRTETFR
jgi:hypothetical protein